MKTRYNQGIEYIDTDKDTHFTGGINQNAKEDESVTLTNDNLKEFIIEGVSVQSDQTLEWDVFFWRTSEYDNTDLDTDEFIEFVNFPTTGEKQIGGANQYYTVQTGLNIPYRSNDGKLHISLCNRSATAKNAGATGEVKIRVMARPVVG